MPRRFISENTLTSRTLARLSAQAEALFWRLVVQADDFGRFRADADIVFAGSYLGPRSAWLQDASMVDPILAELSKSHDGKDPPLVTFYTVDGRRYGVFGRGWEGTQGKNRAKSSKYPPPPPAVVCLRAGTDKEKFGNRSSCSQLEFNLDADRVQSECKPQPNALVSASDPVSVSVSVSVSGESEGRTDRAPTAAGPTADEPPSGRSEKPPASLPTEDPRSMLVRVYGQEYETRCQCKPTAPDSVYDRVGAWFGKTGYNEDKIRYCVGCLIDENWDLSLLPHKADGYIARRSHDDFEMAPVLDGSDLPGHNDPGPPPDWQPPPGWEKGPDGHARRLPVGSPLPEGYVWGVDGQAHDTRRPAPPPKPAPKEKYLVVRDEAKIAAAKAKLAEIAKRDAAAKAAAASPSTEAKS